MLRCQVGSRGLVVVLVSCFALVCSLAEAQRVTGSVFGVVRDESGAVLPGATVEAAGAALMGGAQVSVTSSDGGYRFPSLPPGSYTVKVSLAGFQTIEHTDLRVTVGTSVEENFKLGVASVEETLTVTAQGALVDTAKTAVTTNYNQEFLKNTPITRFTFFDLVQSAPGISTSTPQSSRSEAFGSNMSDNQYQMDGTNLTASLTGAAWPWPSTDVIEEIQIIGVGAPAEYGNVQGAVFNIVTRSGSNIFRGDANWFSQFQSLTSNNVQNAEYPFHRAKFRDGTAQFGGPILKDRLWFFGGYQYRRDWFSQPGTDPAFPARDEQDRQFVKVSWQVSKKNTLMVAFHNEQYDIPDAITTSMPSATTNHEFGNGPTPTILWTSVLSDRTTLEVRGGGFKSDNGYTPVTEDLITPGHYDQATGVYSGGAMTASWFPVWSAQVGVKFAHYAELFGQHHDLRTGIQYRMGGDKEENILTGGINYYDLNGQPDYIETHNPSFVGGRMSNFSVYVDDSWSIGERLKLNLGVRFDQNNGWIPDLQALNADRSSAGTIPGLNNLIKWNSVSPRLGANVKLTQDGRSVVRLSYGRYTAGAITGEFRGLSPAQTITYTYGWNSVTRAYDVLLDQSDPRGTFAMDPNIKQPYTDQYSIGVDHELASNMAIGATFVYKRSRNFSGRRDIGSTFAPVTFTDPENGKAITLYNRTSDPSERRILLTSPSDYKSDYRGLVLILTKRLSNRWQAIASLTAAKVEGMNSSTGGSTGSAQDARSIGSFGEDPNDLVNGYGLMNGDRNLMWKLQGLYRLPYDIGVSINWQWLAGRPYTRRLQELLNQGRRTFFAQPRDGSLRMDSIHYIDMRFEKKVPIGPRRSISLAADIFNIINTATPVDLITETATSPNFAVGNRVPLPRRIMLGVKLVF